jgi:hypothetical protein
MWLDAVTGQPRSFTQGELDSLIAEIQRRTLVGTSLSRKSTNDANLNGITDTRLQAGAYTTNAVTYQNPADTSTVTVTYDRIEQTVTATGYTGKAWTEKFTTDATTLRPCYYEAGNIKVMTKQDVFDTLVYPAITGKKGAANLIGDATAGNLYMVNTTTSVTGASNVDASTVYVDTRANAAAYVAGSIPNTLDQPQTTGEYYLNVTNWNATTGLWGGRLPAFVKSDGSLIKPYSSAPLGDNNFARRFFEWIQDYIYEANESHVGYRTRYEVSTTSPATGAAIRGSGMIDTKLAGQTTLYRFVNANDYRSQDVPSGASTSVKTNYLWVYLT